MAILKPTLKIILLGVFIAQISGCSHQHRGYTHWDDAAPVRQVDINKVKDAQPIKEPRSRSGNPSSYEINGKRYYVLASSDNYIEQGTASWYGTKFHGKRTSSGEPYNMYAMTAAHKTLPLPTYARVTNLDNGKSIVVKINDRGPFIKGRIIDLSYVAAQKLEITGKGTGYVEVKTINPDTDTHRKPVSARAEPVIPHKTEQAHEHSNSNLYLQVGIFNEKRNAEIFRSKLNKLSLPTIRVTTDSSNKVSRYRVRIGPLNSDEEADQLIKLLAREGHSGFRIRVD